MAVLIESNKSYSVESTDQKKKYLLPFILITSLFFLWGMANNLNDILIKQFKKSFVLTDFESGLVQSAFYLGYFLFAIPAAQFMKRYGYKKGIILGLLLYGIGAFLFYPAAEIRVYGFFLFALFIIATGLAFLETAANPYVTVLGPESSAERRLNFVQAFNPLGSIAGILLGKYFIFSGIEYSTDELSQLSPEQAQLFLIQETKAVQLPYLLIGAVVILCALVIFFVKFPSIIEAEDQQLESSQDKGLKSLWNHVNFRFGVLAQFLYVGAQVGIWSYMIRYAQRAVPGTSELQAADYLTISLVVFMAGRFIGTYLMKYFRSNEMMGVFSLVNVAFMFLAIVVSGEVGIWSVIISSFFMSIMFPTIFALSIKGLGKEKKIGASIVIMAIIGGAILTALMGWISDMSSITMAFSIPLLSFIYIAWFSFRRQSPLVI